MLSRGQALGCLGRARLTMTLGTRVIKWSFIVAEIRDDEGILGNDFPMARELTVRPCEGAVYLRDLSGTRKEHMGKRLPCTIRSVTEVRAVTEETLAVRAVGSATLAPHTVMQVWVIVPTPRARGTVMIEMGPGPLGLCPVRGVFEVEKDSSIWLANTGTQPIHIEQNEVVAMAECVMAGPRTNTGNGRDDRDEVNRLVEQAAPHLTDEECQQLRAVSSCGQPWRHANTYLQREKATWDGPTSFSTRYTWATNPRLNSELDATQRRAGRRKGNLLKTCWPSGSSKRATVRGAVRPSW